MPLISVSCSKSRLSSEEASKALESGALLLSGGLKLVAAQPERLPPGLHAPLSLFLFEFCDGKSFVNSSDG